MSILRSPLRSPLRSALRSVFAGGGSSAFDPSPLFSALYDPSALTSLFQDAGGTVAAAIDSPVGKMLDISGGGHHAAAPSDAARPILRHSGGVYWLEFDGVDDCLVADYVQSTYPLTLCAAAEVVAAGALGIISAWASDSYYKLVYHTGANYAYFDSGVGSFAGQESLGSGIGVKRVAWAEFKAADTNIIVDAVDANAATSNTNAFESVTKLLIGKARTSLQFWNGKFFGGGAAAAVMTLQHRKACEKWLADRTGGNVDVLDGIITEGDSITAGSSATGSNGYAQQLATAAPRCMTKHHQAVSGNTMADIAGRLATTQSRCTAMIASGLRPIVTLLTGANDRPPDEAAAATLFAAISSYAASVRSTGAKFVIGTSICSSPGTYPAWDGTGRPALNALIRANANQFDAIADFASVDGLNTWGATYFGADLLHPNDAGHALMLPILQAAVATVRAR